MRWAALLGVLGVAAMAVGVGGERQPQGEGHEARSQKLKDILDAITSLRELHVRNNGHSLASQPQNSENEARQWLRRNDEKLRRKSHDVTVLSWQYVTNLTDANAAALEEANVALNVWEGQKVKEARQFLAQSSRYGDEAMTRALKAWVYSSYIPVADSQDTIERLSQLLTQLEGIYGNAEVVRDGATYRMEPELSQLMATSRDYDELQWAWVSWRDVTGPPMRPLFSDMVDAMNEAARDNGFRDVGETWRVSNYEEDNIEAMVDTLFTEVEPLYDQLFMYVRSKLVAFYSDQNLDPDGPLPAHILGNMWAQEWENIFDLVAPFPDVPSYDVTAAMLAQGYTVPRMFELAESFFTSLGLEPMTETFWEKSMFERPADRAVQCHASAEDFLSDDDFRIKMCTEVEMSYLQTVHHEMGHIEYFMLYRDQPTVFRTGANAAFHEAVGDTIALSVVTPQHLKAIGLLQDDVTTSNSPEGDVCTTAAAPCTDADKRQLNFLMQMALNKVAFLPFGYLIDKWRWEVFRGNIDNTNYNSKWWEFREKYQKVAPPVARSETDFDPGAKYHVGANVPYIRYFLSFLGQFQFHKALCDEAGYTGPIHQCDIYQSTDAGDLLRSVLELGSSRPWPEVMEMLTGQREFTTDAIFEYFQPLYRWLQYQNSM